MDEHLSWVYEQKCLKAVKALQKNGFEAVYCANQQEAYDNIMNEAKSADSIGFGGSVTIRGLQLIPALKQMGKEALDHQSPDLTADEKLQIRRRQLTCDLFLTGSNAVTLGGELVNVDGVGNRVAAMAFGPKKVIVVAGRNKITEDVDSALKRLKFIAGPANSRRLKSNVPCAYTGSCSDCDSPERLCRITVILDRKPLLSDIRVLIVNDDIGY